MRWNELVRGRTLTARSDIPSRYAGTLLLLRLDPDSVGIRDSETGRALRWDDPALDAMGASVVEVRPVAGSQPAFRGGTGSPGTELPLSAHRRALRVHDEYGLVLGDAVEAGPALAQHAAGHELRGYSVRQARDGAGMRTQLHVLVVPDGVDVHFRVPTRSRERPARR